MKRLLSSWAPVALWCGVIYFFSDQPDLSTGWGLWDFAFRKTAHVAEYALLAAFVWRALERGGGAPGAVFWGTFAFSALYAVSDEWHQSFVPGRTPRAFDVLIDWAGAAGACLVQKRAGKNFFAAAAALLRK